MNLSVLEPPCRIFFKKSFNFFYREKKMPLTIYQNEQQIAIETFEEMEIPQLLFKLLVFQPCSERT